jgi:hypothetical protein
VELELTGVISPKVDDPHFSLDFLRIKSIRLNSYTNVFWHQFFSTIFDQLPILEKNHLQKVFDVQYFY